MTERRPESERIEARQTRGEHLGVENYQGRVDFALAFAVVHEVPNARLLLQEICAALKPGAKLLLAKPSGHVCAAAFDATLGLASDCGLVLEKRPTIRRSHSVLLARPR